MFPSTCLGASTFAVVNKVGSGVISSAEDLADGLDVDAVALRWWLRLDTGSMRRYSGTVASTITTARRTKNTSAKAAVLPSRMKVVKSAKYSTMTGFMYAGVGDLEGKLVGVERVGSAVGDAVGDSEQSAVITTRGANGSPHVTSTE